ncbi:hypothetical protein ET006_05255 [Lactococcus garvieae]|uniref:Uncharacterized protein n=1 Tax=Lactococcus formosensis TaxID=1281486 RepID=A0A9Q9D630_9LACT|nr:hypothetical protein [Lactococcus formosensis]NHI73518.1 hypothetical protein [Lactococcus garvieae]UKS68405.1 hypothetical protein G8766_04120 [Lactococcus garvieae]USJ19569.1 hypothetical protein LMK00_06950 [Lactococcus formosensis]
MDEIKEIISRISFNEGKKENNRRRIIELDRQIYKLENEQKRISDENWELNKELAKALIINDLTGTVVDEIKLTLVNPEPKVKIEGLDPLKEVNK